MTSSKELISRILIANAIDFILPHQSRALHNHMTHSYYISSFDALFSAATVTLECVNLKCVVIKLALTELYAPKKRTVRHYRTGNSCNVPDNKHAGKHRSCYHQRHDAGLILPLSGMFPGLRQSWTDASVHLHGTGYITCKHASMCHIRYGIQMSVVISF